MFRQSESEGKHYDLTIKDSNDVEFIKNIEVKKVTSENPSQIAKNIEKAFRQLEGAPNGTVALFFEHHTNTQEIRDVIRKGYEEAMRKNNVKGPVEIWFKDKTSITFNWEEK